MQPFITNADVVTLSYSSSRSPSYRTLERGEGGGELNHLKKSKASKPQPEGQSITRGNKLCTYLRTVRTYKGTTRRKRNEFKFEFFSFKLGKDYKNNYLS